MDEAKNKRVLTGIYQFLAKRNLDNFNPTNIPMTPLRREMMKRNEDNLVSFITWLLKLENLITDNNNFGDARTGTDLEEFDFACANPKKNGLLVSRKHVFERYKTFCEECNEKPLRKNIVMPGIFGRLNLDHDRSDLRREPMHRSGMTKTMFANNRKDCIMFPVDLPMFDPELKEQVAAYKF